MGVFDDGTLSDEQWFALYGKTEESTEEEKKKEKVSGKNEAAERQRNSNR